MTDYRPDIPDLPPGHYWNESHIETAWGKWPIIEVRKRRLFGLLGSKSVGHQSIGEIRYIQEPMLQHLITEDAMRKLGKKLGYE